jgi:hypothetical protein
MPLWVDHPSYFGPDRRQREGRRLVSRRRQNLAGDPPALRTALRRLLLQAQAMTAHNDLAVIERRAGALQLVADEAGAAVVRTLMQDLAAAWVSTAGLDAVRRDTEAALLRAIAACQ